MKENFNDNTNEFHISNIVDLIHKNDRLIGDMYDLSEDEIEFVKEYNLEYRLS
jgi:hypothetical protein